MAIRFRENIEQLAADLTDGGFRVRCVTEAPHAHGRAFNLELSNGTTVCWDKESFAVWAEGPHRAIADVEAYLRRMYEGPRLLRASFIRHNRFRLRCKTARETGALWLIRSEGLPARLLRRTIASLPGLPLRRRRTA